ncbi:hypothetical protein QUA54_23755 [Microcoleus sp. MOSTC5]|uniref:hypothetical protein n=1 Tax=Microcoleus sp. MOSTC5 TaxID=3055378 RepID=UPI002FCF6D23
MAETIDFIASSFFLLPSSFCYTIPAQSEVILRTNNGFCEKWVLATKETDFLTTNLRF